MKKIIEFLRENNIEYKAVKYGNPLYFNDGFSVDGLQIAFDFYFDEEVSRKMHDLEKFMKNKRAYDMTSYSYGAGYAYRIMTVFDARRLADHEKAIKEASENFWQAEHARRMQATA